MEFNEQLTILFPAVVCIGHMTLLTMKLCRTRRNDLGKRCLGFLVGCRDTFLRPYGVQDDKLLSRVKDEVEKTRKEHFNRSLPLVLLLYAFISMNSLRKMIYTGNRWATSSHDVLIGATYLFLLALNLHPSRISGCMIDVANSVLSMNLLATPLLWDSETREIQMFWMPLSILAAFLLYIVCLNYRLNLFWNLLYLLEIIGFYHVDSGYCQKMFREENQSQCLRSRSTMFVTSCLMLSVLSASSLYIRAIIVSSIHHKVEAEVQACASNNQRCATQTLLDLICDSVIELDADLVITDHFPTLSNLLLRGFGRSMKGMRLQQFMPLEDESSRFEAVIGGASRSGHSAANLLHVRLRDSNGTLIPVQFFHIAFSTAHTSIHHMVGIREFSDAGQVAPYQSLRTAESEQSVTPRSFSTDVLSEHGAVALTVDQSASGLRLVDGTHGFSTLIGGENAMREANIQEIVVDCDTFEGELQNVSNYLINFDHRLTINPADASADGGVSARCTISGAQFVDGDDGNESVRFDIRLNNIRARRNNQPQHLPRRESRALAL
eukprot:TRINITY_DN22276_c0_g1_i1.p1 TRINITY_DN22276_c0_g1~~TRINITY_DN22276_c0_g1_i1.p1  ORF type:complete len:551 (-),score=46.71 TRINITY_DN22276_c0_g1_i1:278-1930(-)